MHLLIFFAHFFCAFYLDNFAHLFVWCDRDCDDEDIDHKCDYDVDVDVDENDDDDNDNHGKSDMNTTNIHNFGAQLFS